jgi:hypothetical protein
LFSEPPPAARWGLLAASRGIPARVNGGVLLRNSSITIGLLFSKTMRSIRQPMDIATLQRDSASVKSGRCSLSVSPTSTKTGQSGWDGSTSRREFWRCQRARPTRPDPAAQPPGATASSIRRDARAIPAASISCDATCYFAINGARRIKGARVGRRAGAVRVSS